MKQNCCPLPLFISENTAEHFPRVQELFDKSYSGLVILEISVGFVGAKFLSKW